MTDYRWWRRPKTPEDYLRLEIEAQGFTHVRRLPTGEWAGLKNLVYNIAICVGMKDRNGPTAMFCFDGWKEAETALDAWDGKSHPPGYFMGEI